MKRKIKCILNIILITIIVLSLFACDICTHSSYADWNVSVSFGRDTRSCIDCGVTETRLTKEIGETGEAGGIIYYRNVNGFTVQASPSGYTPAWTAYTAYYLEAAPEDMATQFRWSTLSIDEFSASGYDISLLIDISGTRTEIGTGKRNTAVILELDATAPAALACKNYNVTGYESFNDWFLPSKSELDAMYIAKEAPNNVVGLQTTNAIWSSSQSNINTAWGPDFQEGVSQGFAKYFEHYVRAVRAF